MTRPEIRAAMLDRHAAIATLYGEARGEPIEGLIAVGCVLRARATHPRWWGDGWKGVCLAPAQFSCWWETGPNTDATYAVAEALITKQPLGERSALSEIAWVVDGLMFDQFMEHAGGADHYVTTALLKSHPPKWARGRMPCAVAGNHTFFRLEI